MFLDNKNIKLENTLNIVSIPFGNYFVFRLLEEKAILYAEYEFQFPSGIILFLDAPGQ